jgi:epoxide hydrolase
MEIRSFRVAIPQASLDDLRDRLDRTRWTSDIPGDGPDSGPDSGDYGMDLDWVRRLAGYWRDGYDWRAAEARLNAHPQFITEIDGQDIHFLHVRSPEPDALPLILTHGWPGSVVEYLDVIGPLTEPQRYGGNPADAFHLVIPSLPGFGFSSPLTRRGWSTARTAAAWVQLMGRLGYQRYGAAGNDAGSMVSPEIGRLGPDHVTGVHVTQVFSFPSGTRLSSRACPSRTWPPWPSCSGSWTTSSRSTSCTPSSRRRSRTRSPTHQPACWPGTGSSWARTRWGRRAWTTTSS